MSNQGLTLSETNPAINLLHWSCILDTVNEVLPGSSSFCVYWSQLVTDRACEKQLASFVCIMSLCSWNRQHVALISCAASIGKHSRGALDQCRLWHAQLFSIMHVQRRSPKPNEQRAQRPKKEKRRTRTTTKHAECDAVMCIKTERLETL